jgi:hypothetical protein
MKQYFKYIFLITLFSLNMVNYAYATDNDETKSYHKEELNLQSFDSNKWKGATSGMKYSKKPKAKKTKKIKPTTAGTGTLPPPRPIQTNPYTFKDLTQAILIFLAIVLLAFVIFKAVAGDAVLVNKQVTRRKVHTLKDIETNLHEADVESFLDKALKENNYRLAIRLYYLAIIKELSLKDAIVWKKDKTNGHYLKEMRKKKHPKFNEYKNVTRIFEYVCYSDMQFDAGQFQEVRVNFKDLLSAIK